MHAIWFSVLAPLLVGAAWIWPVLRIPKLWFGLCVAIAIGTAIWVGVDLYSYTSGGEAAAKIPRRILFLFVSEKDKPVLQLVLGLLMAAVFCWRFPKRNQQEAYSPELAEA